MELWLAFTSPFARKVRIAAAELGLADEIDLIEVDPWTDARLRRLNPVAKVPTLVLDDGEVLFESAAICDCLDEMAGGARLFPSSGAGRRRALRIQALADGGSTAAGRLFAEERKPIDQRALTARFEMAITATLDALERDPLAEGPLAIGEVSVAAFLAYLDFRWPGHSWREGRPGLAGWFATIDQRPSMRATAYRPSSVTP